MTRRRLLFGATAFPLLAAAQKPITGGLMPLDGGKIGNTPAMKITDIKTFWWAPAAETGFTSRS